MAIPDCTSADFRLAGRPELERWENVMHLWHILWRMWPTRQQTPMQLAGCAAWSAVFWLIAMFLPWAGYHAVLAARPGTALNPTMVSAALALAVLAAIAGWRALSLLREGLRLGRWKEDEVDALRQRVERPAWTMIRGLGFFLLVACLILALLSTRGSIFLPVGVSLVIPLHLLGGLRNAVRRPEPSRVLDLTTAKAPESKA